MARLPDAGAVDALARRAELQADRLQNLGSRVGRRVQDAPWQGPRADRWRTQVLARLRAAHLTATELRAMATELRRTAQWIRDETTTLRTLERRVRAVMSAYSPHPGSVPPWSGTGWSPANLPPSGDTRWRDVARALRVG